MKISQYVWSMLASTHQVSAKKTARKNDRKAEKTVFAGDPVLAPSLRPLQGASEAPSPAPPQRSGHHLPACGAGGKTVLPQAPMNEAEQQKIFDAACHFLLQVNRSGPAHFANLSELSRCSFSAQKNNTKLLLEGLCCFFAHDYPRSIQKLSVFLQKDPTNRSALIYRFLAAKAGIMSINAKKVSEVTLHLRENFRPNENDIVARLLLLYSMDPMTDWQTIENELQSIGAKVPHDTRILSCLGINSLQAYFYYGCPEKKKDARDFSCRALAEDPTDTFAFSILWHSTRGLGHGAFSPLYGMRAEDGNFRTLLHVSDCSLKAIINYTLVYSDPILIQDIHSALEL